MIREGPSGLQYTWLHSVVTELDFVAVFHAQMQALMLSFEVQCPALFPTHTAWMRDPRLHDDEWDDETDVQLVAFSGTTVFADEGVCEAPPVGSSIGETGSGMRMGCQHAVELISSVANRRCGSGTSRSSAMDYPPEPCTYCTEAGSRMGASCLRSCSTALAQGGSAKAFPPKKVSFGHAVEFWFPATHQLCLSTGISRCPLEGCFPRYGMQHLPVVPPACPAYDPPAILAVPRSNAQAKPRRLAAAKCHAQLVCTVDRPTLAPPDTASSSIPEAVPAEDHPLFTGDPSKPFSSFDEILGTRVLAGEAAWPGFRYMQHAVETAALPGTPTPRILVSELAGYPTPQVALTQDRGPDLRRAVVVEATTIGGDVETLDAFPGVTMIGILRGLRSVLRANVLEEQIQAGHLLCLINKALVDPYAPLPPDTDVIHFMLAMPAPHARTTRQLMPDHVSADPSLDGRSHTAIDREYGPMPQPPAIPLTVHRPATPPVPPNSASGRLVRRYMPGAPDVRPFTVFDAHYGHRTFYCHGFATYPDRVRVAVQASPALGLSPRLAWLDRELEGLPTPQLVLQQAHIPSSLWTFPLDLRTFGGHVCVLIADRQSSALEFMARATDACRLHGRVTAMLATGDLSLEVDGHPVTPDAQHILKFASTSRIQRTQLWGRHQIFRRHGAVAGIMPDHYSPSRGTADSDPEASGSSDCTGRRQGLRTADTVYYEMDADRFLPMQDCSIMVHVAGIQPVELLVPFTASAADICQLATNAVVHLLPTAGRHRCRWRPCQTSPVGEHLLHSVLVTGNPEEQDECHVVLDLRAAGVAGPAFHTAVFPVSLSTELLFQLVTNFLGGSRPRAIFQGPDPVGGHFCILSSGQMLRPIVSSTAAGIRPVLPPALWRTAQCLQVLPGLRLAFANVLSSAPTTPSDIVHFAPATDAGARSISAEFVIGGGAETTTTATAAGTSTTSTTHAPGFQPVHLHPFVGLHQLEYVVHLAGPDASTTHVIQAGRGHLAEVLTELLWCLQQRVSFPPGCTIHACPRLFFDSRSRVHIFINVRLSGAGRFFWLFAPDHTTQPRCLPWSQQLEIPDVLDHLCLEDAGSLHISINGEVCREHPVFAAPGCVVHVAQHLSSHFTMPLHMLRHRCIGIQALHFRSRGPMADQMKTRADLRQFCHLLVSHVRDLLGERLPGNRFVIAGMHTPPIICCHGHFLPPTLCQVQQYYDEHLQRHFGRMILRDTACVQFDYTLVVERQDSVHRRLWLWPCEEGVDSTYGDIAGDCLAGIATPQGF